MGGWKLGGKHVASEADVLGTDKDMTLVVGLSILMHLTRVWSHEIGYLSVDRAEDASKARSPEWPWHHPFHLQIYLYAISDTRYATRSDWTR